MFKPYKGIMPKVAESVFVDDSAQVWGDVVIGGDSSIWANCSVRGDVNYVRIGERTNIQDNSVLHVERDGYPCIVEDDVTVGHMAILHGCTVRSRVLIGMGAKLLNGCEVESEAIVAAGSVVPEGRKIPSGWVAMGAPAKPVRELRPEEREHLLESSRRYVVLKNEYMQAMKERGQE